MSTQQCIRLREAYQLARQRPTKVIVLLGSSDLWSNGIHLNVIEVADQPQEESWFHRERARTWSHHPGAGPADHRGRPGRGHSRPQDQPGRLPGHRTRLPGNPEFPYLGKFVKDLTFAQVKMFDCGTRRPADPRTDRYIDSQIQVPGSKMMILGEVFDLVKRAHATGQRGVMLNIETTVEAGAPEQTAPREQFVQVAVQEIRCAGMLGNVTVQSFDWGALMRMRHGR